MSDQTGEREPATSTADTYHRHGDPDPSQWQEAEAVTDRPPDTPQRGEDSYAVPNSTFADRAKAAAKAVASGDAEDKAVSSASTKTRSRSSKRK